MVTAEVDLHPRSKGSTKVLVELTQVFVDEPKILYSIFIENTLVYKIPGELYFALVQHSLDKDRIS